MERISIVDYYKEYVENIKKLRESEKYQKEFNSIKNICVELIEEIYVLCGKYKMLISMNMKNQKRMLILI